MSAPTVCAGCGEGTSMAAEGGARTGADLLQGILKGQVPRQVRLFAAQGLLPVSREDLFRLQIVLSADPDEELAGIAAASIREVEESRLVQWIGATDVDGIVLDLLARIRREDAIWAAIATHRNVSDETLRVLARHGPVVVQDIIITNQVRVMRCLEILDDLRANAQISQVVMRRVREFEEEFIEKLAADELEGIDDTVRQSIEEALDALRQIGGHIPDEQRMPVPVVEDPALTDAVNRAGLSVHGQLLLMSTKDRIVRALKGSREERGILINSRNRLVVRAVLASPRLSDSEVEKFAASRSVSEEVVRVISSNPRWLRLYPVAHALVQNPKTPVQTAMRLLPHLALRDIGRVSKNRNVNPVVRRQAANLWSRRR